MKFLLDTCTFVWLVAEPKRISGRVAEALDARDASMTLSDVTVWEIGLKWRAGKIKLPQPPRNWIAEQARVWNLSSLAIKRRHLFRETELPGYHRDPFDRLLVAQALEEEMIIATPDPAIRQYPVPVVW